MPQGSDGVGNLSRIAIAAGLNIAGSIVLLTNRACRVTAPALQAAEANSVKSPARIAAVGT